MVALQMGGEPRDDGGSAPPTTAVGCIKASRVFSERPADDPSTLTQSVGIAIAEAKSYVACTHGGKAYMQVRSLNS